VQLQSSREAVSFRSGVVSAEWKQKRRSMHKLSTQHHRTQLSPVQAWILQGYQQADHKQESLQKLRLSPSWITEQKLQPDIRTVRVQARSDRTNVQPLRQGLPTEQIYSHTLHQQVLSLICTRQLLFLHQRYIVGRRLIANYHRAERRLPVKGVGSVTGSSEQGDCPKCRVVPKRLNQKKYCKRDYDTRMRTCIKLVILSRKSFVDYTDQVLRFAKRDKLGQCPGVRRY
ncbi:hypothetical protein ANCCEY_14766, partial [Ancylostoma ceylanicum]